MLRQALIFLVILSTLTTNCSRFFVFAGFELNRNYISSNICENRDKPWMHCNGKCYFMKKIKQAEDDEKKETAKDNLSRLEITFFQEPFSLSFLTPVILNNKQQAFANYTYHYSSHYIDTIFRPPKQIA